MTKHLFASFILLFSIGYKCQNSSTSVGINTEAPSATLSVKSDRKSNKNLELQNSKGDVLLSVKNGGNVGIGHDSLSAALDIKATDADKTLRFSTEPKKVDNNELTFYVGVPVKNGNKTGYNLRVVTLKQIASILSVKIPSLKRIVVTNTTLQRFDESLSTDGDPSEYKVAWTAKDGKKGNIRLDYEAYNSGEDIFEFVREHTGDHRLLDDEGLGGSVKIKKNGLYEIRAWLNLTGMEGGPLQYLLSLAKKSEGERTFKNYKRTPFGKAKNDRSYINVGKSLSFVEYFKAGDELKLRLSPAFPENANHKVVYKYNIAPETGWITVSSLANTAKSQITPINPTN